MSAEPVTCTVLGQTVEGTLLDERVPRPDIEHGPREFLVVEVGNSRYRIEEEDVH